MKVNNVPAPTQERNYLRLNFAFAEPGKTKDLDSQNHLPNNTDTNSYYDENNHYDKNERFI
jgi:hypothetical protein